MTRRPRSCASRRKRAKSRMRPVVRVDRPVVGDVVAVVAQRRGVERQQPEGRDAQVVQVVELRDEAPEVADAVVVAVAERPHVELVDDGVAVPVRAVVREGALRARRHRAGCYPRSRGRAPRTIGANGASSSDGRDPAHVPRLGRPPGGGAPAAGSRAGHRHRIARARRRRAGGPPARAGRAAAHRRGRGRRDARAAPRAPAAAHLPGHRQAGRAEGPRRAAEARPRGGRGVALARTAALAGGPAEDARRGPHRRDPRHLRPARPLGRGQAAGGAGPARVLLRPPGGPLAAPGAPRRRRRHPRPGREPARVRPPPGAQPDGHPAPAPARGRPRPRDPARAARRVPHPPRRAGRLHQRGQVEPDERA